MESRHYCICFLGNNLSALSYSIVLGSICKNNICIRCRLLEHHRNEYCTQFRCHPALLVIGNCSSENRKILKKLTLSILPEILLILSLVPYLLLNKVSQTSDGQLIACELTNKCCKITLGLLNTLLYIVIGNGIFLIETRNVIGKCLDDFVWQ